MNIYKPKEAEGVSLEDSNLMNQVFILLSYEKNTFDVADKKGISGALLTIEGLSEKVRVSGEVLLKQLSEMENVGFPIATKIVQVKGQKYRYYKFAELTPSEIQAVNTRK